MRGSVRGRVHLLLLLLAVSPACDERPGHRGNASPDSAVADAARHDGRSADGADGVSPGPDAVLSDCTTVDATPAACPWGQQLLDDAASGLSPVQHIPGGSSDEQALFQRMNQHRPGTALAWDDCLADVARGHSRDMAVRKYWGHGCAAHPSAFLVAQRASAAGYVPGGGEWLTEDILQGDLQYYLNGNIASAVDIWIGSPGHAAPILSCSRVGIGVERVTFLGSTSVLITADFACDTEGGGP